MRQPTPSIREFYGAANTYSGFYSLFDKIFSPEKLSHRYILKGGPGCGKSTAIRKVSEYAIKKGYGVENYYCSSSPSSFDGVIIPELSVAVLDGTAPHTVDPKYPAICENIINLGQAWKTNETEDMNDQIRDLNFKKNDAYRKAYAYLSSCKNARDVKFNCLSSYIIEDKLKDAIRRICSKYKFFRPLHKSSKVFTDCISGMGNIHLDTFERISETRYFIKDYADISTTFFDILYAEIAKRTSDIIVALDPLDPSKYQGIWLPEEKLSFTIHNEKLCIDLDKKQIPYKIINTARFCNAERFRKNKTFYKYADKCEKTLMNGAVNQLSIAASIHDEIEKCYYKITDFSIVEEMTEELIKRIF